MIVILMGVTGAGKTTVGTLLAQGLGWEFADADSFHSPANIEKISQNVPLDDSDRAPWLQALRAAISRWIEEHENVVLACSALKRSYRKELGANRKDVIIVYLKGSEELIHQRLRLRSEHFATEKILASQYATLEAPDEIGGSHRRDTSERVIVVAVERTPEEIVAEIMRGINLSEGNIR
ncbi:MAG: gluconokinase [Terriglobales bacterium]